MAATRRDDRSHARIGWNGWSRRSTEGRTMTTNPEFDAKREREIVRRNQARSVGEVAQDRRGGTVTPSQRG